MPMFGGRFGGDFGIIEFVIVVFWITILVGGILLLFLAIRWLANQGSSSRHVTPPAPPVAPPPPGPRPDDPLEILRQRYARGEIDDDDYERRRRRLAG